MPHAACAIGLMTQLRIAGGAIGVGICAAILQSQLKSRLSPVLGDAHLREFFESSAVTSTFTSEQASLIRTVYANGFNFEMRIMLLFSALGLVFSLAMYQRKLLSPYNDKIGS